MKQTTTLTRLLTLSWHKDTTLLLSMLSDCGSQTEDWSNWIPINQHSDWCKAPSIRFNIITEPTLASMHEKLQCTTIVCCYQFSAWQPIFVSTGSLPSLISYHCHQWCLSTADHLYMTDQKVRNLQQIDIVQSFRSKCKGWALFDVWKMINCYSSQNLTEMPWDAALDKPHQS